MSKRPWTPGPWHYRNETISKNIGDTWVASWWAHFHNYTGIVTELRSNAKLASKAPEMAEILIELTEAVVGGYCQDDWTDYLNCQEKAKELLKEVGWEVNDER